MKNLATTRAQARTLCATALATLSLAGCVVGKTGDDSLKIGAAMPGFSVSGPTAGTITAADLAGKRTLVVLFRTTCPDCNREMPTIEQAWQRVSTPGSDGAITTDLRLVAISKESAATVAKYWEDAGLTMPWYLDPDGTAFTAFDVHYVPTLYLFGSDGKVAYVAVETFDLSADALVELIEGLK